MSQATPKIRVLAKRLIAHDERSVKPAQRKAPLEFSACNKLSQHLAALIGSVGLRALLARALMLANAEVPGLGGVEVRTDGHGEGLDVSDPHPAPADLPAARIVLLAHLLGLLVAFVGPGITSSLVGEIWPHFSIGERELSNGEKNEKTS